MKKAQMFVLTMVFLVGLVFVIQQGFVNWFAYAIDFYSDTQRNDYYLFDNVKTMAQYTMQSSATCDEARNNLNDLRAFLQSRILSNYFLEFRTRLDCSKWLNTPPSDAPLNASIHITGENVDTYGDFMLYRF
jgi:hypothetical protein